MAYVVEPNGILSDKLMILYKCLSTKRAKAEIDISNPIHVDEIIARMLILQSYKSITAIDSTHICFYIKPLLLKLTGNSYSCDHLRDATILDKDGHVVNAKLLTRTVGQFFPSALTQYDIKIKHTDNFTLKKAFEQKFPAGRFGSFMKWAMNYDKNGSVSDEVNLFLSRINTKILAVCPEEAGHLTEMDKPASRGPTEKFHSDTSGQAPGGPSKYFPRRS